MTPHRQTINRHNEQADAAHHEAREGFYVSVVNGKRYGFLLGPYATHDEALANVERGKSLALESDGCTRSWFYAYGTCRLERATLPEGVFGK